MYCCFH
jgi:hypothetical protein